MDLGILEHRGGAGLAAEAAAFRRALPRRRGPGGGGLLVRHDRAPVFLFVVGAPDGGRLHHAWHAGPGGGLARALRARRPVAGHGGADRIPRGDFADARGALRSGGSGQRRAGVAIHPGERAASRRAPAVSRIRVRELLHDGDVAGGSGLPAAGPGGRAHRHAESREPRSHAVRARTGPYLADSGAARHAPWDSVVVSLGPPPVSGVRGGQHRRVCVVDLFPGRVSGRPDDIHALYDHRAAVLLHPPARSPDVCIPEDVSRAFCRERREHVRHLRDELDVPVRIPVVSVCVSELLARPAGAESVAGVGRRGRVRSRPGDRRRLRRRARVVTLVCADDAAHPTKVHAAPANIVS